MSDQLVNLDSVLEFDFKSWILSHETTDYEIKEENDTTIVLSTQYGDAKIIFNEIEEGMIIVEFTIIARKDDAVKFYLHFQLSEENHAKQLYEEMVETLLDLKDKKTVQVLLSCSAGLTTAMFADSLNTTIEMLGLDFHFEAVSYLSIYEEAHKYDVIMIAPQIGYMLNRLKDSLPEKLVLQIPTAVFASYDAVKAIQFVQEELKIFNETKGQLALKNCYCELKEELNILSVAILPNRAQTRIYYRFYKNGEIVDRNLIIKPNSNFLKNDLNDIVNTVKARYRHIDMIAIATPGIVNDKGELRYNRMDHYNLKDYFEDKYHVKTIVSNNANAAAVGFSLEHPEYKNIVFHSQPFGYGVGGQGIISNGHLVTGRNGSAGEVQFFLRRMQMSDEINKLRWSEQGALEIVTKSILPSISLFGPDIVVIRSPMTPDMNEVKNKLSSFIPDDYMPEFYHVKEASSYMLDGITQLAIKENN